MKDLLSEIESYWTTRAEGYSEVNHKELNGMQKGAWLEVLKGQFPEKAKDEIKILDIGTGPGFFPVILAEAGYKVTAVDYTQEMLDTAKRNAGNLCERISFYKMDAQNLEFEDDVFDVVISRNLTWNLKDPKRAYEEWCRVLKPGGKLLNFDANWYGYLMMRRNACLMRKTERVWRVSIWMIITSVRILTEWRRLHCRCLFLLLTDRPGTGSF